MSNYRIDIAKMWKTLKSLTGFQFDEKLIVPVTERELQIASETLSGAREYYRDKFEGPVTFETTPRPAVTENTQLKFLLSQAPMIDWQPDFVTRAATPYAYVHPKTLAGSQYTMVLHDGFITFLQAKMQTKWLTTSLMPEGCVLFSPNPIPGMEKRAQ